MLTYFFSLKNNFKSMTNKSVLCNSFMNFNNNNDLKEEEYKKVRFINNFQNGI